MTENTNQEQVVALVNYHREVAKEAITEMKDYMRRGLLTQVGATVRTFRERAKDLREELAAMLEELDAADAWVEREYQRIVKTADQHRGSKA